MKDTTLHLLKNMKYVRSVKVDYTCSNIINELAKFEKEFKTEAHQLFSAVDEAEGYAFNQVAWQPKPGFIQWERMFKSEKDNSQSDPSWEALMFAIHNEDTCKLCGQPKPKDQSCICFDNHCQ